MYEQDGWRDSKVLWAGRMEGLRAELVWKDGGIDRCVGSPGGSCELLRRAHADPHAAPEAASLRPQRSAAGDQEAAAPLPRKDPQ